MVVKSVNHDWLDRVREDALEPDLPICDPHHHLWDHRAGAVQSHYLQEEILADISGEHNIVSTVFIECGVMFREDGPEAMRCVGETEFINGIAERCASEKHGTLIAKGIIGTVDFRIGDATADVLDAHIEAGGGRFRGVRRCAFWHESPAIRNHRTNPPPQLLLREDFREGFRHLAARNLSFEAWVTHTQIRDVIDLARAFPDTLIVLNHCGGPLGIGPYAGKRDEVFTFWKSEMDALATCANVTVKLGGLNMDISGFGWEHRPLPPSSMELAQATRPYIEYIIDRFGTDRCMFESNFPVDKHGCGYTVLWNSFKLLTADYSNRDRAALFHDTAARVYRLDST